MKKRLLAIFVVIAMLVGLFPALPVSADAMADGSYYDGCYYFSIYDGEATILSYESNYEEDDAPALIEVPSVLGGCPVTAIGYESFTDCKAGKLVLPDTVKMIGAYAFYRNEDIGEIVIPAALESVGTYAFYGANMGDVFYFPTVTYDIGYYAFAFINTDIVVLPDGMESIGSNLFAYAYNESIVIPSSVTAIEYQAFNGSRSLQHAFFLGTADQLAAVFIDSGNSYLNGKFHCAKADARDAACGLFGYTGYSCLECDAICAVTRTDKSHHVYQNGICTVCDHAVADDWSVEPVEGGIKLTAYNGTDTVIEVPSAIDEKAVVALGDNLFKNRSDVEGITLPQTIRTIGSYAFYNCKKLTKLNLPESVTVIEPYTFYGCSVLSTLRIPSKVTKIGQYAFYECRAASELKIPSTLSVLEEAAFQYSGIEEVVLPEAITTVPRNVFNSCTALASVKLPNSLKRIESGAFYGIKIAEIKLPSNLEQIGDSAFYNCTNLNAVVIPNSVTKIEAQAFRGCTSLSDVTLPNDITELPNAVFWYTNLKNFKIPNSVTYIGSHAIHLAAGETVMLPASVQSVAGNFICASSAENHDDNGKDFTVTVEPSNPYLKATKDGVFSKDGKCLYAGFISEPDELAIRVPNGVETVGDYAYDTWYMGDYFKNVVIPASVKTIGYEAFDINSNADFWYLGTEESWNAIEFDESMGNQIATSLEYGEIFLHYATASNPTATCQVGGLTLYACASCDKSLALDYQAGEGHCFDADEVCTVCGASNTVWSYDIEEEQAVVTGYSGSEKNLVMPQKLGGYPVVSTQGELMIYGWSQQTIVKTVHLPSTLKKLGDNCFNYTYNLSKINFPSGLEEIGAGALRGTSLSSIDLPDSVKKIGDSAFANCKLLNVGISGDIEYGMSVFGGNPIRSAVISGDISVVESWFAYCEQLEKVTLSSNITEIGDMAFSGCSSLKEINIPWRVVRLGASSFSGCKSLAELELPSGLKTIGGSAFAECVSLKSLEIPAGVERVDSSAFSKCESLKSIVIPASATVQTDYLFEDCKSLESFILPQTIERIGSNMFRNCAKITSFSIPEGVVSIDSNAFAGTNIRTLHLPKTVGSIDSSAFYENDWAKVTITIDPENPYLKIQNNAILSADGKKFYRYVGNDDRYAVPAGVEQIEGEAFAYSSLKELILPDGLEKIWGRFIAFSSITEITIPNTVTTLGHTFWDANALQLIVLEDGIETLSGYGMFINCQADILVPKSVTMIDDWFEDTFGRILYKGTPEDRAKINFEDSRDERTLGIWHYVTAESYRAPTCAEDGAKIFTCSDPTETIEIKIPAAHQFDGNFCSVCRACRAYSAHPYAASTDESKTLSQPGATWMALTFADDTYVEAGSDFIELYNGAGELLARYTGSELAGKRVELESNTIVVRLVSDDSVQGYGYQVEALDAGVRLEAESGASLDSEVGVVDPDAILVAEEFEPTSEIVLPEGSGDAAHFEIHIEKDAEELQPNGEVTVRLPVPAGMDGESCDIYRVESDGNLTDMEAFLDENGTLSFKTEHFSHYVVVEMKKSVDSSTVVAITRYLNGTITEADPAWDVNGDGKVTLADALRMLKQISA